ncbi:hypothetical protein CRE_21283 [Caenorhabditis remanei]|uniref:Ig-like domain-containing protein n=1 Tax=Caenorhabditis remanei TaxID=31234 RepID=E3MF87_CAERE|nr:hypothetical protein CRE_21283 [Caenorhabditis remanei]
MRKKLAVERERLARKEKKRNDFERRRREKALCDDSGEASGPNGASNTGGPTGNLSQNAQFQQAPAFNGGGMNVGASGFGGGQGHFGGGGGGGPQFGNGNPNQKYPMNGSVNNELLSLLDNLQSTLRTAGFGGGGPEGGYSGGGQRPFGGGGGGGKNARAAGFGVGGPERGYGGGEQRQFGVGGGGGKNARGQDNHKKKTHHAQNTPRHDQMETVTIRSDVLKRISFPSDSDNVHVRSEKSKKKKKTKSADPARHEILKISSSLASNSSNLSNGEEVSVKETKKRKSSEIAVEDKKRNMTSENVHIEKKRSDNSAKPKKKKKKVDKEGQKSHQGDSSLVNSGGGGVGMNAGAVGLGGGQGGGYGGGGPQFGTGNSKISLENVKRKETSESHNLDVDAPVTLEDSNESSTIEKIIERTSDDMDSHENLGASRLNESTEKPSDNNEEIQILVENINRKSTDLGIVEKVVKIEVEKEKEPNTSTIHQNERQVENSMKPKKKKRKVIRDTDVSSDSDSDKMAGDAPGTMEDSDESSKSSDEQSMSENEIEKAQTDDKVASNSCGVNNYQEGVQIVWDNLRKNPADFMILDEFGNDLSVREEQNRLDAGQYNCSHSAYYCRFRWQNRVIRGVYPSGCIFKTAGHPTKNELKRFLKEYLYGLNAIQNAAPSVPVNTDATAKPPVSSSESQGDADNDIISECRSSDADGTREIVQKKGSHEHAPSEIPQSPPRPADSSPPSVSQRIQQFQQLIDERNSRKSRHTPSSPSDTTAPTTSLSTTRNPNGGPQFGTGNPKISLENVKTSENDQKRGNHEKNRGKMKEISQIVITKGIDSSARNQTENSLELSSDETLQSSQNTEDSIESLDSCGTMSNQEDIQIVYEKLNGRRADLVISDDSDDNMKPNIKTNQCDDLHEEKKTNGNGKEMEKDGVTRTGKTRMTDGTEDIGEEQCIHSADMCRFIQQEKSTREVCIAGCLTAGHITKAEVEEFRRKWLKDLKYHHIPSSPSVPESTSDSTMKNPANNEKKKIYLNQASTREKTAEHQLKLPDSGSKGAATSETKKTESKSDHPTSSLSKTVNHPSSVANDKKDVPSDKLTYLQTSLLAKEDAETESKSSDAGNVVVKAGSSSNKNDSIPFAELKCPKVKLSMPPRRRGRPPGSKNRSKTQDPEVSFFHEKSTPKLTKAERVEIYYQRKRQLEMVSLEKKKNSEEEKLLKEKGTPQNLCLFNHRKTRRTSPTIVHNDILGFASGPTIPTISVGDPTEMPGLCEGRQIIPFRANTAIDSRRFVRIEKIKWTCLFGVKNLWQAVPFVFVEVEDIDLLLLILISTKYEVDESNGIKRVPLGDYRKEIYSKQLLSDAMKCNETRRKLATYLTPQQLKTCYYVAEPLIHPQRVDTSRQ